MCFFFWLFCAGGVLFSSLFSLCPVYWFFVSLLSFYVSVFLVSWLCVLYAPVFCLCGVYCLLYVCVVLSVISVSVVYGACVLVLWLVCVLVSLLLYCGVCVLSVLVCMVLCLLPIAYCLLSIVYCVLSLL